MTPAIRLAILSLAALSLAAAARAADDAPASETTFHKDVLPILQANCQTCHRPGGDNYTGMVAPMPLLTFDDARPWAKAIAREVAARRMPPWKAAPEFHGLFRNERALTDAQIAALVRWSETGARRGDPADGPEPLVFPDTGGWRIGTPDLVVSFDEPFFVADDVQTLYTSVRVPLTEETLPESRWIKSIEWRGGSEVVHHIVGYAILPGHSEREPGNYYGLGSIAPGEEPMSFPDGYAKLLVKGSTLIFSMHYHKEPGPGTGVWDRSSVAFKFHPQDAPISHFVDHGAIGSRSFELPPRAADWKVGAARTFDKDTTLLALHPHMHLRGKDATYRAFFPDGTVEVLLHVPAWDFNWQTDYSFVQPRRLPAGTRLEYAATFDNSAANPANPNPDAVVMPGQQTTDEMMLGYITYADSAPRQVSMREVIASLRAPGELGGEE